MDAPEPPSEPPADGGVVNHMSGSAHVVVQAGHIHGDVTITIPSGVEALPLHVAALDYSSALSDAGIEQFTGREWLLRQILSSFPAAQDDAPGRYVLVTARAGMGKTALAGWLARNWACACHFTASVARGRDTDVALRSLAAQLVLRHGLEDRFAPGGMLVPWAGDPAYFPTILAAAAERAGRQGRSLRIVVDGLDEASGEGPALGLPDAGDLPAGVQIVATCREGTLPRRLPGGERVTAIPVEAEDPRNRADVVRFLTARAAEEQMAGRLDAARIPAAEFVRELAERSGGVWIYLRYVLAGVRLRDFSREDLNRLPSGLADYYRRQVTAHQAEPEYYAQDLPALATLAVAEQPLSVAQLALLADVEPGVLHVLCGFRYRPFLSLDTAGGTPRYAIHHSSLREFLRGTGDGATGTEAVRESARDALMRSTVAAADHRVADHYLNAMGGLRDGLPALAGGQDLAVLDDRYPLRHLPTHLDRAGRHDELHTLLTCRRPGDTSAGTLWAEAHEQAGTLDDYFAAVRLLRAHAERRTDRQLAEGRPARALATETECALLAAAVVTRSDAIPAALLDALVSTGTWDVARALAHAYRPQSPAERAERLAALLPHVADPEQAARVRRDAVAAATAIEEGWIRVGALIRVAPHLDAASLRSAVRSAATLDDDLSRARALAVLGSQSPGRPHDRALEQAPDQGLGQTLDQALDQALGTALGMTGPLRHRALRDIAPYLDAARLDRMRRAEPGLARENFTHLRNPVAGEDELVLHRRLDDVAHIRDGREKAVELCALLPHLRSEKLRSHALHVALGMVYDYPDAWEGRARALSEMASYLRGPERARAVEEALKSLPPLRDRAGSPADGIRRLHVETMARVALGMAEPDRSRTLAAALAHARTSTLLEDLPRQEAVSNLQAFLDGRESPPLTLRGRIEQSSHAHARKRAATSSAEVAGHFRVWDAAGAAARLTGPARERGVERALQLARSVRDPIQRAWAFAGVAPHLGEPRRGQAFDTAWETVLSTGNKIAVREVLVGMAPFMDWARLARALDALADICDEQTLANVLPRMAAHLDAQLLDVALRLARGMENPTSRAKALSAVAGYVQGPAGDGAVDEALRALAVLEGCEPHERAWILADVVQNLDARQLPQVLDLVLALPRSTDHKRADYMENRALEEFFLRLTHLVVGEEQLSAADAVGLLRRFYRALPPLHCLFMVTSVSAPLAARIGGRDVVERHCELVRRA